MSRKKQVYEKITALYCRISLDDGGDNESMSIYNDKKQQSRVLLVPRFHR